MKIESIIKRDPPTEVVLGDTAYQFVPDSRGRHVCEVTDKGHIARLLSIAEGFQIPDDEEQPANLVIELPALVQPPASTTIQPVDENILLGSSVHPATFDLGDGKTAQLGDVVAQAHELSGMTTAEWNAMPDEARHQLIDAVLDGMAGDSDDKGGADENKHPEDDKAKYEAEREALAMEYKAKFGIKPHYKWTMDKIREELAKPVESTKD